MISKRKTLATAAILGLIIATLCFGCFDSPTTYLITGEGMIETETETKTETKNLTPSGF